MQPDRRWRRDVHALAVADFLCLVSFTMFLPFLPLYLRELGVTRQLETWSGLIFGASFLAGGLMSPVWGALGDRYGHRLMIVRSGVAITAVHLLFGFAGSPWQLLALRLVNGLAGGFLPASNALVAAVVPGAEVGRALGLLQVSVAAGGITGPLVGGLVAGWLGLRAAVFAAAAVMGVATLLSWRLVRPVPPDREVPRGILAGLRAAVTHGAVRRVAALVFLVQTATTAGQPVLALLVERVQGAGPRLPVVTGLVFAAAGLATALGTPLWARLADGRAARGLLTVALGGTAATSALHAVAATAGQLAGARFLFGFFSAGAAQVANVLLALAAEPALRGRAFGLASSAWMLGVVAGSAGGGWAAHRWGVASPFWLAGLVLLPAALALGARRSGPGRPPARSRAALRRPARDGRRNPPGSGAGE